MREPVAGTKVVVEGNDGTINRGNFWSKSAALRTGLVLDMSRAINLSADYTNYVAIKLVHPANSIPSPIELKFVKNFPDLVHQCYFVIDDQQDCVV